MTADVLEKGMSGFQILPSGLPPVFRLHNHPFFYETGNGIHAEEAGYIKNKGDEKHETLVQHGKVTYHDEHGHPITITYVADEHGFQVQGDHLPTPPPIPKEILEGLAKHQHYLHEEEEQQDHVQ
nr:unnamed protein product [Callosobruchus analis]